MSHINRLLVAGAAIVLLLGACTEASTTATSNSTSAGSTPTSAQGPTTTAKGSSADTDWALQYTGGKAGTASGTPFNIGYANQEQLFPEATIGLDAAVKFANAELDGVDGHPIVVDKCTITVEEDGQACGTRFANDPKIRAVLTGTLLVGAQGLYAALNGKKPVLIGNGLTTTDFTTTAGFSFTAGAVGVVTGLAMYVADTYKPKPKKVAVMYGNNASAQGAYQLLMLPVLKKAGIKVAGVQVTDPGGTSAQVQSAIQNVGADSADVFITLTTQPECLATYDAIQALNIHPTVITTGLCFGTPMTKHIQAAGEKGVMPNGWYFGDYGYHYYLPDVKSGMQTYLDKVKQYGVPAPGESTLEYTGFAGPTFANVMTLNKFANAIGFANATPQNLFTQIRAFKGPMMLQVGPIDCGHVTVASQKLFVSLCASQMGIILYKNLKWTEIAGGLNGNPIDASKAKT
jgi:branched-chain amino acid transport system substrate-binding protein